MSDMFRAAKQTAFVLLFTMACLATPSQPAAASAEPAGAQFLLSAFSPPFPVAGMRVEQGGRGDNLLVITTHERLKGGMLGEYTGLLLKRGISIFGASFHGPFDWEKETADAAITMTRKAAGEPAAVEVSTSVVRSSKGGGPVHPLAVNGNELVIPLAGEFGRGWRKLVILPEREPAVADPKVGRYPGARLREAAELPNGESNRKQLVYAARGAFADVYGYYYQSLRKTHSVVTATGDPAAPPAPTELFGIKTAARLATVAGYSYHDRVMRYTEVTLKQGADPNLAEFVEIEVREN